jgi:hypothetical protein
VVDEPKSNPPGEPKIKVVDRRKFTADGDPVETVDQSAETEESGQAASPGGSEKVDPEVEIPRVDPEPPPTGVGGPSFSPFLELVAMIAGQAEILLVGAEDLPARPAEAKRMIDYLGVLEEKTAGNLSAEESEALSTVLYQLRTDFLQKT